MQPCFAPPKPINHSSNPDSVMGLRVIRNKSDLSSLLRSSKPSIILGIAEWVAVAALMEEGLTTISKDLGPRVQFCKFDADQSTELRDMFGISKLPATIFLQNGEVVTILSGPQNMRSIRQLIDQIV